MAKQSMQRLLLKKLKKAIEGNNVETIASLLDKNTPVNGVWEDKETPLLLATSMGHSKSAKLLMERGANPNALNILGETALHLAAKPEIAEALIRAGADVNALTKNGTTPLNIAAANGRTRIVKILIQHGSLLDREENTYHQTPLIAAVINMCAEVTKQLVSAGADLERVDTNGATALMYAVSGTGINSLRMVECLLGGGANPDMTNDDGWTALMFACEDGSCQIVQAVINAGANINHRSSLNETALSVAVQAGREDNVKALMRAGAEVHIRISHEHADPERAGKTARELAFIDGRDDIVRIVDRGRRT